MAASAHSMGASSRALSIPDCDPLQDTSNILASVMGQCHLLAQYLEGIELPIGMAVDGIYTAHHAMKLAKDKVDASLSALLAYKNAQEGR